MTITIYDLCEVREIATMRGLSMTRAAALYNELGRPQEPAIITRRHDGTIGGLEVVL